MKKEDKEDISNFLEFQRKSGIDKLNKGEARELITKLLERRVAHETAPDSQRINHTNLILNRGSVRGDSVPLPAITHNAC